MSYIPFALCFVETQWIVQMYMCYQFLIWLVSPTAPSSSESKMWHMNPCSPEASVGCVDTPELYCCTGTPGETKDSPILRILQWHVNMCLWQHAQGLLSFTAYLICRDWPLYIPAASPTLQWSERASESKRDFHSLPNVSCKQPTSSALCCLWLRDHPKMFYTVTLCALPPPTGSKTHLRASVAFALHRS